MFPQQHTADYLHRHVALRPHQAALLAGYLDGRRRPDGITPARWERLERGEAQAIAWRDLGALCDAYGAEILDLLR